jgi:SET domain-containing protein
MIIETRTESNAAYKLKVKRSKAGLGLFAAENIQKGKNIIEYVGIVRSSSDEEKDANKYIFNASSKVDIDGSPRYNTARYINHSCAPNAESIIKKGHVWISSLRPIAEGEEITYDYGKEYFNVHIKPFGCRCIKCIEKREKSASAKKLTPILLSK